jgi:hypothetical protein
MPTPPPEPPIDDLSAVVRDIRVPVSERSSTPPELPDDQVEHPDEGGDAPLSIDDITAAIRDRANSAAERLETLRKERDEINRSVKVKRSWIEAQIKSAVAELAEAKRIANALTPRKPRAKKTTK